MRLDGPRPGPFSSAHPGPPGWRALLHEVLPDSDRPWPIGPNRVPRRAARRDYDSDEPARPDPSSTGPTRTGPPGPAVLLLF